MHSKTLAGLVLVCVVLGGVAGYTLTSAQRGGTLTEQWVSDTGRDTRINHHAVGIGPQGRVIVAPVAIPYEPDSDPGKCAQIRLAPSTGAVEWRASVPPAHCRIHSLTEPAIADVDGDGTREVAYASTERGLHVLNARTGAEEARISLQTYGYARPTVANLSGTSTPEIVAVDIDGGIVVARPNGSVVWRQHLDGSVWYPPRVGDLDGDGTPELVVGTGQRVVALDNTGRILWRRPVRAVEFATGQADDDPGIEVFASGYNSLAALDGDGEVLWRRETDGNPAVYDVAGADGDGTDEVYVGVSPGRVLALSASIGTVEWSSTVLAGEGRPMAPPVVGDLDGTGPPEIVAVTSDGTVTVLDGVTGAELAAYEREVPIYTYPTVADIDGDGDAEILVRYGDGRVVALQYSKTGR